MTRGSEPLAAAVRVIHHDRFRIPGAGRCRLRAEPAYVDGCDGARAAHARPDSRPDTASPRPRSGRVEADEQARRRGDAGVSVVVAAPSATCASRIPNSLGRIRPTCVASAQCGPRRVVARHGARPPRRGMCAACVARQPPGIRQTPGGRRLSAHDCPCWRVTPLLLSNGSPRAVGFPSHASPYQLARRRRA